MAQFNRLNPLTGEVASSAEAMQAGDIPAVAARAQEGFATWSKMGPNARRAVLNKAADALVAKKDQFVAAMMGEIGSTAGWAMFNLMLAAGMVREAAAAYCTDRLRPRVLDAFRAEETDPGIFREMFQLTNPSTDVQPRAPS